MNLFMKFLFHGGNIHLVSSFFCTDHVLFSLSASLHEWYLPLVRTAFGLSVSAQTLQGYIATRSGLPHGAELGSRSHQSRGVDKI